MRLAIVMKNSMGCELGTYEVEHDDDGPLILAAVTSNVELRAALSGMEPGDTFEMVDLEAEWRA